MRVHHLAIQVPDLDAAYSFYVGVLGLALLRRQHHSIWVDVDGVILMLEQCSDGEPDSPDAPDGAWVRSTPGLFVVALAIDPATRSEWRTKLTVAGVTIDHESTFSLYFRDPWGVRLALSHHPHPAP
jgi:catechol 2,3-dioxygenase-like lactoylglutathione lyase family enzyme